MSLSDSDLLKLGPARARLPGMSSNSAIAQRATGTWQISIDCLSGQLEASQQRKTKPWGWRAEIRTMMSFPNGAFYTFHGSPKKNNAAVTLD